MADVEGGYLKFPSYGMDSDQHSSIGRRIKTGATLLGGSCLVAFLIVATYSTLSLPALHSTNSAESTSLFSSIRAPTPVMNVPARAVPSIGQFPINTQGKFLSEGFQPSFQNSPYQSRSVLTRGIFGWGNTRDEKLYKGNEYKKGDKVDYLSSSGRIWLESEVTDVSDKGVMVSAKPGVWLPAYQQKTNLRMRFKVKGYSVFKGKNLDLPERATDGSKKLMDKQKKIEKKWFGQK